MRYKIRDARLDAHLTIQQLSERSGISRTTIWSLESGRAKSANTGTLSKIAKALGTDIRRLFDTDGIDTGE